MGDAQAPDRFAGQPNAGVGTPDDSGGLSIRQLPDQRFSAKWGEHELALVRTQAEVAISADDAKHRRGEEIKDNDQRRNVTYAVVLLILGTYAFTGAVVVWGDDPDTRDRAWDILNVLIGALAGAMAGYFAGDRKSKR